MIRMIAHVVVLLSYRTHPARYVDGLDAPSHAPPRGRRRLVVVIGNAYAAGVCAGARRVAGAGSQRCKRGVGVAAESCIADGGLAGA